MYLKMLKLIQLYRWRFSKSNLSKEQYFVMDNIIGIMIGLLYLIFSYVLMTSVCNFFIIIGVEVLMIFSVLNQYWLKTVEQYKETRSKKILMVTRNKIKYLMYLYLKNNYYSIHFVAFWLLLESLLVFFNIKLLVINFFAMLVVIVILVKDFYTSCGFNKVNKKSRKISCIRDYNQSYLYRYNFLVLQENLTFIIGAGVVLFFKQNIIIIYESIFMVYMACVQLQIEKYMDDYYNTYKNYLFKKAMGCEKKHWIVSNELGRLAFKTRLQYFTVFIMTEMYNLYVNNFNAMALALGNTVLYYIFNEMYNRKTWVVVIKKLGKKESFKPFAMGCVVIYIQVIVFTVNFLKIDSIIKCIIEIILAGIVYVVPFEKIFYKYEIKL